MAFNRKMSPLKWGGKYMKKRKIIVVLGPTASGKSVIALELAKEFNGFLISADSRQVYRGMDIGTNKDEGAWQDGEFFIDGIEECLIDVVSPNEEFTVGDWLEQTGKVISERKNKLPIIVGGTGLYIFALINDFQLPAGKNERLRAKFEKLLANKGLAALIDEIKKIDPDIEQKIDSKNPRRALRAAEIVFSTGKPLTRQRGECEYDVLQIGVELPRETLYEKINRRVDEMFAAGLVKEVKTLVNAGYQCHLPAMTSIGYRQVCQFLEHEISGEKAVELIKRDTRHYAKRQMTWFKRDKTIHWIENGNEAIQLVENFLAKII